VLPFVLLHGEIKSPPFSREARVEAGFLFERVQRGEKLSMPHSRPMPSIGKGCHEMRVRDENKNWRIVYRIDEDAVLVIDVFEKKSEKTPKAVIDRCKQRLKEYDEGGES
jgi:phage-related protein